MDKKVIKDAVGMVIFLTCVLGVGAVIGMIMTLNKVGKGEWHIIAVTNVQTEVHYQMNFK